MKCQHEHCGGSIIEEWDTDLEKKVLKCMSCGREPKAVNHVGFTVQKEKKDMETKMKKCNTCKEEKPATNEHFGKNMANPDKLDYRCKECWKDKRAEKGKQKANPEAQPKAIRRAKRTPAPLTTASPEAIVLALRKGIAAETAGEIVAMIKEKYGL